MFFKMLTYSLLRRRSRMTVALLSVAIGATVLLGMAAVSYDIPRQMGREFRSYGANMIFVASGEEALLRVDAAQRAAALIPPDELIGLTPYRYGIVRVNMQGYTAVGTDFDQAAKTSPYWSIAGEYPKAGGEILIGADVAEFTKLAPGSSMTVTGRAEDGTRFRLDAKISGTVRTGSVEDGFIFMPMPTLESLMGSSGVAEVVEVSIAADETELKRIVSEISREVPEISPRLVKRVTQSETTVLSKLQALVFLVSLVVLVLTMICVATTMMTVVLERRKEIGLKKALGADNRRIAAEFLGEGLFLGSAGGALGAVFGYMFAQAISMNVFGRAVTIDWRLPLLAVLISIAVTIAACLLPVRRAMDVEPALVLRGE
jgi:putative ABC transport system permease protein